MAMAKMLRIAVVLSFLLAPGMALAAADGEHRYIGAKKCKKCHGKANIGNQWDSWLESTHAKAYETLAGDQAKEWATEAGVADAQTDEKCVKCHMTAHGVADELLPSKWKPANPDSGVQCEACHGAGRDYRKKKTMIDQDLAVSKGLVLQSAEVCTVCHNDESPAWDAERYTLADGTKTGFDYDQAAQAIAHPVPEDYDPSADGEAD